MNQWVRDALETAGLSQQALGYALTRAGVGNFDRSIVQKMTVSRRITMDEAAAIAEITGHPLPDPSGDAEIPREFYQLSEHHKAAVKALIRGLLANQQDDK